MKSIITASIIAFALSSCATTKSKDKNAPAGPPSATFVATGGGAAYYASASGGSGTLTYKGKQYPFSATAAGVGGTGATKFSADGEVYNMNSLSDFAGTYTMVTSGITIGVGKKHAKLTNNKGVVMYVEEKTSGLSSTTGTAKVMIKLK
jgi:hypothetical protein